jgi:hypothetical protein
VRFSELEAWDAASHAIVELIFGADSPEARRWRGLTERRAGLAGEAMRKDIKRGEYFGLIDYFHLAIGALLEFEAAYRHRQAAEPAIPRTAGALVDQSPTPVQEPPPTPVQEPPPAPAPEPPPASAPTNGLAPAARAINGGWELTIAVSGATYRWLAGVATAREPEESDEDAAARLAATIVERVAANTRAEKRHG